MRLTIAVRPTPSPFLRVIFRSPHDAGFDWTANASTIWFGLTADEARQFAALLLEKADELAGTRPT